MKCELIMGHLYVISEQDNAQVLDKHNPCTTNSLVLCCEIDSLQKSASNYLWFVFLNSSPS